MAFLNVEDHNIRYELAGSADHVPLVFVNGLTQAAHLWGVYVLRLVDRGYRVLTFDMLGQGESDKPVLFVDFDRQARIMAALIEKLGLRRPVVAGISFGGAVALRYAILYPDGLRGLVAMGAFKQQFSTLVQAALPFIVLMLLCLGLVIWQPWIGMYFVNGKLW